MSRGPLSVVVCGLLIAALVVLWSMGPAASGLSSCDFCSLEHRLNRCGTRALFIPWRRIFLGQGLNLNCVPCIGRQTLHHWATREAPLPCLYLSIQAQPKCHLLKRPCIMSSPPHPQELYFTFSNFRFFLIRCIYIWMYLVTCPIPFSAAGKQALEGPSHLCPVHRGSQCLACTASPIDVALTCAYPAAVHLSEVWHSLF